MQARQAHRRQSGAGSGNHHPVAVGSKQKARGPQPIPPVQGVKVNDDIQKRKDNQEEMQAISRGLKQGVKDLEDGRRYEGYLAHWDRGFAVPEADAGLRGKGLQVPLRGEYAAAKEIKSTKAVKKSKSQRSLKGKTARKSSFVSFNSGFVSEADDEEKLDLSGDDGGDGECSDESSEPSNHSVEEDTFLSYPSQEIDDAIQTSNRPGKQTFWIDAARSALNEIEQLYPRLKIDDRARILKDVGLWFKGNVDSAALEGQRLTEEEERQGEVIRRCDEDIEEVRELCDKSDRQLMYKLNIIKKQLRKGRHGHKPSIDKDRTVVEQRRNSNSFAKDVVKGRIDSIDVTLDSLRNAIGDYRSGSKQGPPTDDPSIPKASDLLQIIADQQDEIVALTSYSAITTARIDALEVAAKYMRLYGEINTKHEGETISRAMNLERPAGDTAAEVLLEVRSKVQEAALVQAMTENTDLKYLLVNADNFKGSHLAKVEFLKRQEQDIMLLKDDCDEVQESIENLRNMRESGTVKQALKKEMERIDYEEDFTPDGSPRLITRGGRKMSLLSAIDGDDGGAFSVMSKVIQSAQDVVGRLKQQKSRLTGDTVIEDGNKTLAKMRSSVSSLRGVAPAGPMSMPGQPESSSPVLPPGADQSREDPTVGQRHVSFSEVRRPPPIDIAITEERRLSQYHALAELSAPAPEAGVTASPVASDPQPSTATALQPNSGSSSAQQPSPAAAVQASTVGTLQPTSAPQPASAAPLTSNVAGAIAQDLSHQPSPATTLQPSSTASSSAQQPSVAAALQTSTVATPQPVSAPQPGSTAPLARVAAVAVTLDSVASAQPGATLPATAAGQASAAEPFQKGDAAALQAGATTASDASTTQALQPSALASQTLTPADAPVSGTVAAAQTSPAQGQVTSPTPAAVVQPAVVPSASVQPATAVQPVTAVQPASGHAAQPQGGGGGEVMAASMMVVPQDGSSVPGPAAGQNPVVGRVAATDSTATYQAGVAVAAAGSSTVPQAGGSVLEVHGGGASGHAAADSTTTSQAGAVVSGDAVGVDTPASAAVGSTADSNGLVTPGSSAEDGTLVGAADSNADGAARLQQPAHSQPQQTPGAADSNIKRISQHEAPAKLADSSAADDEAEEGDSYVPGGLGIDLASIAAAAGGTPVAAIRHEDGSALDDASAAVAADGPRSSAVAERIRQQLGAVKADASSATSSVSAVAQGAVLLPAGAVGRVAETPRPGMSDHEDQQQEAHDRLVAAKKAAQSLESEVERLESVFRRQQQTSGSSSESPAQKLSGPSPKGSSVPVVKEHLSPAEKIQDEATKLENKVDMIRAAADKDMEEADAIIAGLPASLKAGFATSPKQNSRRSSALGRRSSRSRASTGKFDSGDAQDGGIQGFARLDGPGNEVEREKLNKFLMDLFALHTQNSTINDEIATVEEQIRTVKQKGQGASALIQAAAQEGSLAKAAARKDVPEAVLHLRGQVGRKQIELKKLRQNWWSKKGGTQTAVPKRVQPLGETGMAAQHSIQNMGMPSQDTGVVQRIVAAMRVSQAEGMDGMPLAESRRQSFMNHSRGGQNRDDSAHRRDSATVHVRGSTNRLSVHLHDAMKRQMSNDSGHTPQRQVSSGGVAGQGMRRSSSLPTESSPTTDAAMRHMKSMARDMLRNSDDSMPTTAAQFRQAARRISVALAAAPDGWKSFAGVMKGSHSEGANHVTSNVSALAAAPDGWKSRAQLEIPCTGDGMKSSHSEGANHVETHTNHEGGMKSSHSEGASHASNRSLKPSMSTFHEVTAQLSSSENSHGGLRPKLKRKNTFAHRHNHDEERQQYWAQRGDSAPGDSAPGRHRNALTQNALPDVKRCAVNTFELALPGEGAERNVGSSKSEPMKTHSEGPGHSPQPAELGQSLHAHFAALPAHGDHGAFRGRRLLHRDHPRGKQAQRTHYLSPSGSRQASPSGSRQGSPSEGQERVALPHRTASAE